MSKHLLASQEPPTRYALSEIVLRCMWCQQHRSVGEVSRDATHGGGCPCGGGFVLAHVPPAIREEPPTKVQKLIAKWKAQYKVALPEDRMASYGSNAYGEGYLAARKDCATELENLIREEPPTPPAWQPENEK
jgi:hypothetical protein